MKPALILGPLLRYTGERDATVWVETDGACEVEVRTGSLGEAVHRSAHRAHTFRVEGHSYALVHVTGLEPGESYAYEVYLNRERCWPYEGSPFPPSVIRAYDPETPFTLVFGSCRVSLPNKAPYTLTKEQDDRGRGVGALWTLAQRMKDEPPEAWPDALLMLGDQIYADIVSPGTLDFIRSRRSTTEGAGASVADFEEYTHLYYDAWSEPMLRWLFSTIPVAMIFDDHDVHDDWNSSEAWVKEMRQKPWWEERIISGFMSYWVYQHLGNLSPADLAQDDLLKKVLEADDATAILREFALEADRRVQSNRWSYYRDFGNSRLLVLDTRAGRILEEGNRSILDVREWDWVEENARGGFDHLLIGSSLPAFMAPGLHHLEAWNQAVCAGAWGETAAKIGEKIRTAVDLEHWAAFPRSFRDLVELVRRIAAGERGRPPASITILSGDVHHGYLAEIDLPGKEDLGSSVYQAVCSPLRNILDDKERLAIRFGWSRIGEGLFRLLARAVGERTEKISWRLAGRPPWFENHIGAIVLDGRRATLRVERAMPEGTESPEESRLEEILEHRLA